jgi:hypothetical protein
VRGYGPVTGGVAADGVVKPPVDGAIDQDLLYLTGPLVLATVLCCYPPKMLQEIMGHASITTTLDLYGHPVPRRDGPLRGPARGRGGGCRSGQMTKRNDPTPMRKHRDLRKQWHARRGSNPSLLIRSRIRRVQGRLPS